MTNMVSNRFINSMPRVYLSMSDRPGEEVKIKLKHDEWEVEITCIESRVKQVVENVLSSLDTAKIVGPVVQGEFDELRREIELLKSRSVSEARPPADGESKT